MIRIRIISLLSFLFLAASLGAAQSQLGTGAIGGAANGDTIHGVVVAINRTFNADFVTINGRIIGGDTANFMVVSGFRLNQPTPTIAIATTPGSPVALGSGNKLSDSATLSNGNSPTGTIKFQLFAPDGTTLVYTDHVPVNGNGTYTTSELDGDNPGGFLPTAAGTYQWVVSYSGDENNKPVTSTQGQEPETVTPASPAITTTTGGTVRAGRGVLTDSATLSGGFNPTGTITFALFGPTGVVDVEQVAVNGNGTYSTPHGFAPSAGGVYQWVATYSGDGSNNAVASAFGSEPEQFIVQPVQIISKRVFLASSLSQPDVSFPTGHRHRRRHHGRTAVMHP